MEFPGFEKKNHKIRETEKKTVTNKIYDAIGQQINGSSIYSYDLMLVTGLLKKVRFVIINFDISGSKSKIKIFYHIPENLQVFSLTWAILCTTVLPLFHQK